MSISFALSLAKKYANGGRVQPMTFHGIPISIENKKGTIREGINSDGKSWSNKMAADYGYIKRTLGKDGDQVDVFVGPNKNSNKVFIIDQLHHSKVRFDEHKCLVGFNDRKQALTAYHKSYGRKYGAHHSVGGVTEMSLDAFKEWLKGGGGKKPISPDVPKYQLGGVVEGAKKVGSALYEGVKDWASTPGEIAKQETPELPQTGELTEEDEYLRRAAIAAQQERAAHWGGESALNLYGTSAPFRMPRRSVPAPTAAAVEPETVDIGRRRVLGGLGATAAAAVMPQAIMKAIPEGAIETLPKFATKAQLRAWQLTQPTQRMTLEQYLHVAARNMGPRFDPHRAINRIWHPDRGAFAAEHISDETGNLVFNSHIPLDAVGDAFRDIKNPALAEKGPPKNWKKMIDDFLDEHTDYPHSVDNFADGGRVVFDPEYLGKYKEEKTPNVRVREGHQEFEQGYIHGWDVGDGPTTIMNMRGQQLEARKAQEGGAVKYTEPTEEDPTRYPYYESDPGPGTAPPIMDAPGVGPVPTTIPTEFPALPADTHPMEPTLQEAQMGQQELPEGLAVNDAGQIFRKDTGEVISVAPRPSVLPLYRTSEGQTSLAMPKMLDILGNVGAGWSVPTRGAEAVLGAGFVKGVKEPQKYGFKGDPFKEKTVSGFELDPVEVKASKQITGTLGTSKGGTFTGFSDGINRYIKEAKSLDHAREEVLASKLYELAGVPAAKMQVTTLKGKPAISSEIISGAQQLSKFEPYQYPNIKGIHEHHPADAWLANWDWGGFGPENYLGNLLVDAQNDVHRIDFGGALSRRGLGGSKGDLFTDTVGELQTLKQKQPSLLKDATLDPNNPTANRIANITDKQISDLVYKSQIANPEKMIDKLIARRDDLAKQYGIKKGPTAPEEPPPVMSESEFFLDVLPYKMKEESRESFDHDFHALLFNNKYSHRPGQYDAEGIANDLYTMAEKVSPGYVDSLFAKLPEDIKVDVNASLSGKIAEKGDPFDDPFGAPTEFKSWQDEMSESLGIKKAPKTPLEKLEQISNTYQKHKDEAALQQLADESQHSAALKPMSLNKTHTPQQILASIQTINAFKIDPKLITPKQVVNIKKLLLSKTSEELANGVAALRMPKANLKNIESWLPPSKKAELNQQIGKINEKLIQEIVNSDPDKSSYGSSSLHKTVYVGTKYHDAIQKIDWRTYNPGTSYRIKRLTPLSFPNVTMEQLLDMHVNPTFSLFHGGKKSGFYPETLDPRNIPAGIHGEYPERALSGTHSYDVAREYTGYSGPTWKDILAGQKQDPKVKEFVLRAPKAGIVDWSDLSSGEHWNNYTMSKIIEAGHDKNLELLIVKGLHDMGGFQDQYAILRTEGLRALTAKFDPKAWHLRLPFAGLVGGGLFSYGMLRGQEDKEQRFARGGSVKSTKSEANYRLGTKKEKCAICTMFRPPDSCTAVQGSIRPQDTCDYFELSKRKNPMPLKKGSSQKTISSNVREFHSGDTYAKTKAKFGKARADKQAVAVAMSTARKYGKKKQSGGEVDSIGMPSLGTKRHGMLHSSIPGRTDKLPLDVPAGAYVLPADIPSALGQGNTLAGDEILGKMFKTGPFGTKIPKIKRAGPRKPRLSLRPRPVSMRLPRLRQEGGEVEEGGEENVPIIAAGGEFIVAPEVVKDIGHGDLKAGHNVLDKFVLQVRKHHIDTLKKLKPPKQ